MGEVEVGAMYLRIANISNNWRHWDEWDTILGVSKRSGAKWNSDIQGMSMLEEFSREQDMAEPESRASRKQARPSHISSKALGSQTLDLLDKQMPKCPYLGLL